MPTKCNSNGGADDLAAQAFLYASGELSGAEARRFEHRLAEDQAAREALCQAVELARALQGLTMPRPGPGYRANVRARLLPAAACCRFLAARRPYRGHPALWSVAGALAATLLILCLQHGAAEGRAVPPTEQGELIAAVEQPDDQDDSVMKAVVWADLHTGDHLARVRDDRARRRSRSEERLLTPSDDRLQRWMDLAETKQ